MQVFLVGGAVRDALLGLPARERDWLVVGATPEQMLARGYTPVGKDFPVFLHPQTREEYALARTERKSGRGYGGFQFDTSPDISVEQDLYRRDLTINAMAQDATGQVIDPYGGQRDLQQKILRHVSPAFIEDPLRVLRVARFAARYHPLGFRVAEETLALMRHIHEAGELQFLVAERVWQEIEKAILENCPAVFIETLRSCGALVTLLPEVDRLFGVPQRAEYHPEVDSGIHALLSLQQAAHLSNEGAVRFAALVHDVGKGSTPPAEWPAHIAHEKRSLLLIRQLCQRLPVPHPWRDLALLAAEFHTHCHRAAELRAETLHKVIKACRALHHPERLEQFLLVCEADARGRTGLEQRDYPQPQRFRAALAACRSVSATALAAEGYEGARLGKELEQRQIEAIRSQVPKTGGAA